MQKEQKLSCVIIGGGTLPIRCAEIWLAKNHEICAVVSADAEVVKWTQENNHKCFAPDEKLAENLQTMGFDFLFSIVNEHILREDSLSCARRLAINYHDAPLPRYGGTHATSWAILNGEKTHGITWHTITEAVDAGDILKQKILAIDDDETALTLNTKCYEAATRAFAELTDELAAETCSFTKQNLAERTFFPRFKRPANGAVINWNDSAAEISRLVRALDFGAHPNALGTAKIAVRDQFFIVKNIEISDRNTRHAPGTISRIAVDFVQVATADREIIVRELFKLNGEPVAVGEIIGSFALTENFRLENPATAVRIGDFNRTAARRERFWLKKLSKLEPAIIPYADQSIPAGAARPKFEKVPLPSEFAAYLGKQPHDERIGLIIAAFGGLLARLNGGEAFDLGFSDVESQNQIRGIEILFAAEVPLRCEINFHQSIAELTAQISQEIEKLKENLTFALDLCARYPSLKAISKSADIFAPPISVAVVETLVETTELKSADLKLIISKNDSEILWCYDERKISGAALAKLIDNFANLLRGIAAEPQTLIANLPLVGEAERRKILVEWNDNCREYPKNICIQQLFEQQAAQTPDAAAIYFGDEIVSYHELNECANRLAQYLRKLGVKPETLVGVALNRTPEMIVAVLGVLKAGGAYLPLDPNYPRERIQLMLADSAAPFLITTENLSTEINSSKSRAICLDRDARLIARASAENLAPAATQNNLAYVIYTSGSTGKPKGVAIEHRSAAAFIDWALTVFSPEDLRGTVASTSLCFDLSVFEMFAPLACGGALILVENILHLRYAHARNSATLINTVPSAIAELCRIEAIPPSVKIINLAGEPLKTELVRKLYEIETVKKIYDLYGPTEDTTYSTYTLRGCGKATIGRPIANTQAYILDRFLQIVPVGIAGELYLGGDGLAREYLNRPELTAEKFIKNPFIKDASVRIYKTGDLAKFNESGEIEYLGRIDNQVKIRGFRIELGEIESRIAACEGVRETVVVARETESGEKSLVAYYVLRENYAFETQVLRDFLKEKLPDFMIPSAFVELREMPLTPNGKIDRKLLPAPLAENLDSSRIFVAHRDSLERQIIGIWEDVLETRPIGISDDFFALGGHSLQAVRMFAEIEKTFNVNIPLATLFQAGTIEKLAEILRQDNWNAPESSLVPIQPDGAKPIFFCIHAKGGNVLFYRDLAKRLGADQPFYGVQARRIGGRQVGHHDLKEMAEFYIGEIKKVQPRGPYFLGGSSFGGLAAFEMARQLVEKGEKVELLALLDTGTPDYPKFMPETSLLQRKIYDLIRRVELHRDNLSALNFRKKLGYALEKLKKVRLKYRRQIRDNYKKAVRKFYARTKGAAAIPKAYIQLEDQIWRAGQNYQPEIYAGDVTLFRATLQPLGIEPDETLGWREYVGGNLEIHDVPGHHGSIVVEPYVATLAEKLKICLENAQGRENEFRENSAAPKARKRVVVGV